jgi:peptidoglycan/xylan/chitin deacetylase (PgdA/CDA1 family)
MSWSDIQAMQQGGMQFGGHTRSHPVLTMVSPDQVQAEVKGSRTDLERELKTPVYAFAYPFGAYNAVTQAAVQRAGYWGSCSVKSGLNTLKTPSYALRRIEIYGTDSLLTFTAKLWLGASRIISRPKDR